MKITIGAFIEGYMSIIPVAIATRRDEYMPIPKDKIPAVTMNVGELQKVWVYLKSFFKLKIRKYMKRK